MHSEFLMGNEAIALGALAAGVNLAAGYPGTPSTEILETIAKRGAADIHVEWSINEKAGLEVAAGAAYSGARTLVTMKQVGLNVAADPLMSLEYIGVKGGLVIVVADDPGPISSQTEQDTRTFGMFSKVPVFDPSTVAEAYAMVQEAFAFSEKYHTPVFLRPTTRIDHTYEAIEVRDEAEYEQHDYEGFVKEYRENGVYSHNAKSYPFRKFLPGDNVHIVGRVLGKVTKRHLPTREEAVMLDELRHDGHI